MRTIVPGVRTFVLIAVLLCTTLSSFSQSISSYDGKFEIGVGLGPLFFLGDLGGNKGVGQGHTMLKDLNFPLTKLAKGLHVSVYPTEFLGFRLAVNQGLLEGYDSIIVAKGGDEVTRKDRNLEFKSNLLEANLVAEFYPTVFFEQYDGLQGKFRPYGLIGIGVYHFNPQGRYLPPSGPAQWVDLQPLRLEGQGMAEYPDRQQYSLTQLEIPMGFGFKYYLKEHMYVGLEMEYRKLFTDYVDNVSTTYIDPALFDKYLTPSQAVMAKQLYYRGNLTNTSRINLTPAIGEKRGHPQEKDAFFSTILRFGWRLNDWNNPRNRELKHLRCPSFY